MMFEFLKAKKKRDYYFENYPEYIKQYYTILLQPKILLIISVYILSSSIAISSIILQIFDQLLLCIIVGLINSMIFCRYQDYLILKKLGLWKNV